ncbi:MAG: Brix domain-containing protein [Acidilobus sp.]
MSSEEGLPLRLHRSLRGRAQGPRVIITTSHRPGRRTRTFVRDLEAVLEGLVRLTRGHLSLKDLEVIATRLGAARVVIVLERMGNPGVLVSYSVGGEGLTEVARLSLSGVTLSRELRSRAKIRCRGVYALDTSSISVAEAIARAFDITRLEEPSGCYFEVRQEGGVFVVLPRSGQAFSGPVIRVREVVGVGGQGNG